MMRKMRLTGEQACCCRADQEIRQEVDAGLIHDRRRRKGTSRMTMTGIPGTGWGTHDVRDERDRCRMARVGAGVTDAVVDWSKGMMMRRRIVRGDDGVDDHDDDDVDEGDVNQKNC